MMISGANRAYQELKGAPHAQAAVLDSMGDACRQLAKFDEAKQLLTDALKIRREVLPPGHRDLATSCFHMAWYYHERGDFEKAKPLYLEAWKFAENYQMDNGRWPMCCRI
jgi:tetratricopeptide (TPR) repeat protein